MVGPWFNAVGESEDQVSSRIDDKLYHVVGHLTRYSSKDYQYMGQELWS